ncbi:anaerobic ribonucleoside-triphosphate reductase activating protein [Christensenellaceae bacterium OttesenSCG-928-K19]|nr:anaerobic ribonucleoside-triphosphate reductase activating protein [Christensenellaceae bacterium OttesenSCG-928-K19]
MSSTTSDSIRVAGIVNDSIVDGPGLRITIFMQGCLRNCPGCHNPEAMDMAGGQEYTVEELFEKIQANPLLDGVTFSGGEPLLQAKVLVPLARRIKEAGLSLAVYTGDTLEGILMRGDKDTLALLGYVDTLIDGPFLLAERSLALSFRGSGNQRVLDVKKSLEAGVPVEDECWGRR